MKQIKLPADFYGKLYKELMDTPDVDTCVNDLEVEIEYENYKFVVELTAIFDLEEELDGYCDYTYSYAVISRLAHIEDVIVTYDDGEEQKDVTDFFDYEAFWRQAK